MNTFSIAGNLVDVRKQEIYPAEINIENGKIVKVMRLENAPDENLIMPGFIDSHVHIESSMLVPSEFARIAAIHGTVATVSDPHEIANVLGIEGVKYMMENAAQTNFKFYFGAPSCVPATDFETAGAKILSDDIKELFDKYNIKYLSEMMNFPGVLYDVPEVMEKIRIARERNLPVDGHAPGLRGDSVAKYVSAGISTDHECYSFEEAMEKISHGMKILIREGSAAKNYEALSPLLNIEPDMVMFCSDDLHPDDFIDGHIDRLVRRSLDKNYKLWKILKAAVVNPIEHYKLDVGLLQPGDDADFILVDNLKNLNILKTYIKGEIAAVTGKTLIPSAEIKIVNKFEAMEKTEEDFRLVPEGDYIRVIEAIDGELITNEVVCFAKIENGNIISDTENDILKMVVINRYKDEPPAIGFIKNLYLERGAIATSVAHDSHNIIAAGASDREICQAVNAVIRNKGGMAVVDGDEINVLPLPIAGLMSNADGFTTAAKYSQLNKKAKELGSNLNAPFMTLSFMALLVIPKLKLSDKGLFDGEKFEFVEMFL